MEMESVAFSDIIDDMEMESLKWSVGMHALLS
jgi:hypothetical protein